MATCHISDEGKARLIACAGCIKDMQTIDMLITHDITRPNIKK